MGQLAEVQLQNAGHDGRLEVGEARAGAGVEGGAKFVHLGLDTRGAVDALL